MSVLEYFTSMLTPRNQKEFRAVAVPARVFLQFPRTLGKCCSRHWKLDEVRVGSDRGKFGGAKELRENPRGYTGSVRKVVKTRERMAGVHCEREHYEREHCRRC